MKVRVAYKTVIVKEIEVGEQYAECLRLADVPWGEFPAERINEWYRDCDDLYDTVREELRNSDPDYDGVETITTLNGGPLYN